MLSVWQDRKVLAYARETRQRDRTTDQQWIDSVQVQPPSQACSCLC